MRRRIVPRDCAYLFAVFYGLVSLSAAVWAQTTVPGQTSGTAPDTSNASGNSSSSTMVVSAGSPLADLVVPQGTSLVLDFSQGHSLDITGNLSNFGTIYAVSNSAQHTTAVINAQNVFNSSGAMISSVVPGNLAYAGIMHPVDHLNLTFNTINNFVNSGSIVSAGNLQINAGGSIINSVPAGQSVTGPLMQALGNIDLFSGAGSIVNSGVIASQLSNINITSALTQNIIINNQNGILQALNGHINVRDSLYTANGSLALLGGDIRSQSFDFFSGEGKVVLDLNNIEGALNISARESHVQSASPVLQLSDICLSGDPTFYNTAGDIVLDTPLTFPGQKLAIVASGNIISGNGVGKIDTSSFGDGGEITLVAGLNFTTSTSGTTGDPFAPVTLTFTGSSVAGGRIDLTAGSTVSAITSASTGTGSGGNITLLAARGLAPGSGSITIPSATRITTGGAGGGNNGNVSIFANSNINAISIGEIDTRGGTGSGGSISVVPQVLGGPQIVNGGLTSAFRVFPFVTGIGAFFTSTGSITTGNLAAPGAPVTIIALGNLSVGSITSTGIGSNAGGTVKIIDGQVGGGPFIIGGPSGNGINGTINVSGGTTGGAGGTIQIGDQSWTSPIQIVSSNVFNLNTSGGDGGKLSLSTQGSITLPGGFISVNGAGAAANGGSLNLAGEAGLIVAAGQIVQISANGAGTGSGGSIAIELSSNTTIDATKFMLSATGGSVNSSAGNGGSVSITSTGGNLIVDPAAIDVNPKGINGNGGKVSLFNSAGPLSVLGAITANGNGLGDGGSIALQSGVAGFAINQGPNGNGVAGALDVPPGSSGGNGGSIGITAPSLSLLTGTLSADGTGTGAFKGGAISLNASTISVVGGTALALSANAAGTGSGGSVTVNTTQDLSIGTGLLQLYARGGSANSTTGDGGSITVVGKNVVIDPVYLDGSPAGKSGSGSNLSITANQSLFISSSILANGVGTGNGGKVQISTTDSLVIGSGTLSHGVNGSVTANAGSSGGSGGQVIIGGTGSNFSPILMPNLTLLSNSSVQANGSSSGSGGFISLGSPSFVGSSLDPVPFLPNNVNVLNLQPGQINVDGGLNGGTLILAANTINVAGSGQLGLSARGNVNGGTVEVVSTGAVNVGSTPSNIGNTTLVIDATGGNGGGSGDGGRAFIIAQNIAVDTASLNVAPSGTNGNGGTISMRTTNNGAGTLSIYGPLSVDGVGTGRGGYVNLTNLGFQNLSIGPGAGLTSISAASGAKGSVAGRIDVTSIFLSITAPSALAVSSAIGNGGIVSLQALGSMSLASGTYSANGNVQGGVFSINAGQLLLGPGGINLIANGGGTGAGGSIGIIASSGAVNIGAGQITVQAQGGTAGGSLYIDTPVGTFIDSSAVQLSPTGPNGNGALFQIHARLINVIGDVNADATGTGRGGTITLGYFGGTAIIGGTVPGPNGLGVTGNVTANSPAGPAGTITIDGNAVANYAINPTTYNPIDLTINSSLSAGSILVTSTNPSNVANTVINIQGGGTVQGGLSINAGSRNANVNVAFPLVLSSATANQLSVTAPTISVPAGGKITAPAGITFNSGNILNNGLLIAPGTGAIINIQNTSDLTVSGNGAMSASQIIFTSTNGAVNVHQSALLGTVSGSGKTGFSVTLGSTVTTSASLALSAQRGTLLGRNALVLPSVVPTFGTTTGSTVLGTDSLPRSISLLGDSLDDAGSLSVGRKLIVVNNVQAFCAFATSDDSLEFADEGTELSEEEGEVYLRKGQMLVNTGETSKVVRTPQGQLRLGRNSTAVVKVGVSGTVSTTVLNGKGEYVRRTLGQTASDAAEITLEGGQELVANNDGLDDEELVPADGIARGEPLLVSITKTYRTAVKRSISVKQMVDKSIMVNGSLIHVRGTSSAIHKRYVDNVKKAAGAENADFKPIAFVQPVHKTAVPPSLPRRFQDFIISSPETRVHSVSTDSLNVENGSLFVHASRDLLVTTGQCAVMVKKGNCAYLYCDNSALTLVRACSGIDSVTIRPNQKQTVRLSAGEELLVSGKTLLSREVFEMDRVGHRNLQMANVAGKTLARSEFSICSLLNCTPHLKTLRTPSTRQAHSARAEVLKSAAIVQMVLGRRGPYSNR